MYKSKKSLVGFLGLLTLFGAIVVVVPHTGFGQDQERNGETDLNCDDGPCDAVGQRS